MGTRILLIDGESNRRHLIRRRLERQGFRVQAVRTVENAFSSEEVRPGDVVLCDLGQLFGPERERYEEFLKQIGWESVAMEQGEQQQTMPQAAD